MRGYNAGGWRVEAPCMRLGISQNDPATGVAHSINVATASRTRSYQRPEKDEVVFCSESISAPHWKILSSSFDSEAERCLKGQQWKSDMGVCLFRLGHLPPPVSFATSTPETHFRPSARPPCHTSSSKHRLCLPGPKSSLLLIR